MRYVYAFLFVANLFMMAWNLTEKGGPSSYGAALVSASFAFVILCLLLAEQG